MSTRHPALTALRELEAMPGVDGVTLDVVVDWAASQRFVVDVAPRLEWALRALRQGQTLPHDAADLEDAYGFDASQAEIAPFVAAMATPHESEAA